MRRTRQGFTVIEVMVAMAIFFGAVIIFCSSYLDILNAYAKLENDGDYKNDIKYARAMLMAEPDFDTAEKGAEFETTGGHRISWKATIEGTNVADLFAVTFECDVNAAELKEPVHLTEKFRLLRPTWSKPDDREKLRADARTRIQQLQGNNGSGSDTTNGTMPSGGGTSDRGPVGGSGGLRAAPSNGSGARPPSNTGGPRR